MLDPDQLRPLLVPVTDAVLDDLVKVATADASADEVTPPLSTDGSWTPARIQWLRNFHTERRSGIEGPAAEATWAVVLNERVVGSVRLKRTTDHDVLETGAWLARSARGRRLGRLALTAVLQEARHAGARAVRADRTIQNLGALAVLGHLGFQLRPAGQHVTAMLVLPSEPGHADPTRTAPWPGVVADHCQAPRAQLLGEHSA